MIEPLTSLPMEVDLKLVGSSTAPTASANGPIRHCDCDCESCESGRIMVVVSGVRGLLNDDDFYAHSKLRTTNKTLNLRSFAQEKRKNLPW